jgi:hypothetical protein
MYLVGQHPRLEKMGGKYCQTSTNLKNICREIRKNTKPSETNENALALSVLQRFKKDLSGEGSNLQPLDELHNSRTR